MDPDVWLMNLYGDKTGTYCLSSGINESGFYVDCMI